VAAVSRLVLSLGIVLALAGPAAAEEPLPDRLPPAPVTAPAAPADGPVAAPGAAAEWGDGQPSSRPSATPAKGDQPYNLRQIGFAAAIMLLMALLVVWLVRRSTRGRR
jgi:hypothetical protein